MIWSTAQFRFVTLSRPLLDRLLDHAAEEEPRRRRADPRQARPDHRRAGGAADGHEGAAARLFQGHAGGQGAGLRRRRQPDAGARRDGGHDPRPRAAPRDVLRAAAASGFSTATDLADWLVRRLGLPFRDAHHVTGALVKARRDPRRRPARPDAGARCGRSIPALPRRSTTCSAWTIRSRAGRATAAPRPSRCARRSPAGARRWHDAPRRLARSRLCLALAALAACGLKGDPRPPEPDETGAPAG